MAYNSTKVDTANKILASNGGNFEGVNIFNGATAAVVYIVDDNTETGFQICNYNNDPTMTVEDSSQLSVGDLVFGANIPVDTKIESITNATEIELTASTTGGDTTGPVNFETLSNTLCKFHVAANTTYFYRGFNVVCRNGIKIVSTDWSNLEVFTLHN
jgi:hypothetical protein